MLAIAAHIPWEEIGGGYFQETHPQQLFGECSVYCEQASVPDQVPWLLGMTMRHGQGHGRRAAAADQRQDRCRPPGPDDRTLPADPRPAG